MGVLSPKEYCRQKRDQHRENRLSAHNSAWYKTGTLSMEWIDKSDVVTGESNVLAPFGQSEARCCRSPSPTFCLFACHYRRRLPRATSGARDME